MKPLTFLELKALVPALAATTQDGAQGQIESHIKKGRLRRNEDGTFDAYWLDGLWALDPDHAPKSDEEKASLLGKRIEALDAELETLRHKMEPLLTERDLLRARKADFVPILKTEDARDRETSSQKHDREKHEAETKDEAKRSRSVSEETIIPATTSKRR